MPVIAPNSLIVVTGITGYIGSHVGLAALQAGLRVRGTVRDLDKAKDLPAAFDKQGVDVSKLELVLMDNLSSQEQFEKALEGAEGIAHVVLDNSSSDLVKSAYDSNIALLQAAAKTPSIKRVVICSSSITAKSPGHYQEKPLTADDWNDAVIEEYQKLPEEDARSKPEYQWLRYFAAKTLAEKAAWKWVEEKKPTFELVTILPNMNIGPTIYGPVHSSAEWVHRLLHNDTSIALMLPPTWYIDVRDDGRLHVLALTNPSLGGKRIWGSAGPFGWNQILSILRKHLPNAQVATDIEGPQGEIDKQKVDNSVATQALGSWISLEQSLVDTIKGLDL